MTDSGKKYEEAIKKYIDDENLDSLKAAFREFLSELEQSNVGMPYDIDDTLLLHTIEIAIKNGYSSKQMLRYYLGNQKTIKTDKMIDQCG